MTSTSQRRPGALPTQPPSIPGHLVSSQGRAPQPGAGGWSLPIAFLGVSVLIALVLLLLPADARAAVSGLAQLGGTAFAALCSGIRWGKTAAGRARWAWGCVTLALALYVIGDIIIAMLATTVSNSSLILIPSDAVILPAYFFLIAGVIWFPPETSSNQLGSILDACIAIGAVLGVAFEFLLVPRTSAGKLADYIWGLYPLLDISSVLIYLLLMVRGKRAPGNIALFWLLLGMMGLTTADGLFNYSTLPPAAGGAGLFSDQAIGQPWVAFGYIAAPLAFSMAAIQGRSGVRWGWLERLSARLNSAQWTTVRNQLLILSSAVLLLGGLLIYAEFNPNGVRVPAVALVILTIVVVVLILVRQLVTTRNLVDARVATERAQQLDALKDQFISNVSHELRTPIQTIYAFMENLRLLASRRLELLEQTTQRQEVQHALAVLGEALAGMEEEASGKPVTRQVSWQAVLNASFACYFIAQQFQREAEVSRELAGLGERSFQAIQALARMVKNILEARQFDQGAVPPFTPEVVSVKQALDGALALVDAGERRVMPQIPDNATVWGSTEMLQNILLNLLSNAIKYSAPGHDTRITIAAYAATSEGPQPTRTVEIVVRDNGLGIPSDQQEHLFQRFARLPREVAGNIPGSGLGLFLCRVYAEAMGGKIWVESSGVPGQGSAFHLRMPLPQETWRPSRGRGWPPVSPHPAATRGRSST